MKTFIKGFFCFAIILTITACTPIININLSNYNNELKPSGLNRKTGHLSIRCSGSSSLWYVKSIGVKINDSSPIYYLKEGTELSKYNFNLNEGINFVKVIVELAKVNFELPNSARTSEIRNAYGTRVVGSRTTYQYSTFNMMLLPLFIEINTNKDRKYLLEIEFPKIQYYFAYSFPSSLEKNIYLKLFETTANKTFVSAVREKIDVIGR